jgi:uncharacterized protein (DUF58 family)
MKNQEIFRKVRELEITTRGLVNQIFSGEYHSVFKGRGMEFSEVREYQVGDDIRNIDWNVTARLGHPFIKVFEEERELTLMLLIDMSGSQDFGSKRKTKREIAAEISAILAFSALKNNDKVGCIIFTDVIEKFIPPGKKKTHILRIIREILGFEPTHKGTSIKGALEYLNSVIKKRSIVFVISDFMDKGYEQNMRIIGRRHDLVGIVLNDEREKNFPASGFIKFVDPETGEARFMDTSDPQFKRLFQFRLADDMADMKHSFSASKLDSVTISTPDVKDDFSYIKPLIQFFKQRAKHW